MIDITQLSPVQLDRFIHMQSIIDRQEATAAKVRALRSYYAGDHPVLLTQRQQEFLGELVTEGDFTFAHNLVRSVIDTLGERLDVNGYSVNGETADDLDADNPTPDAQLSALLWQWWQDNRLDSQQIRLYRRALRDGRTYAIVDYDQGNGYPRINLHKVDDGKVGVTYHRDPTDHNHVLFANRYFYTYDPLRPGATGIERKTTYLPHEIRKYIRLKNGDWEPFDAEDGVWPLPWRDNSGEPLGIPVFEFENPGGSEIAQIIGLQNALNKSWLDLIAAADTSGFPLIAVEYQGNMPFGAASDDANIEDDDEFHIAPGRAIEVDNANVHRLEASNLQPMIETIWALVTAIAGVSRTPQYYLRPVGGNDVPSGESLKQLESGLVRRAEQRQLIFGQSWADAMAMMIRVAQTYGNARIPESTQMNIATIWMDANVRNELQQAQVAQIQSGLNVPDEFVWGVLGYTPEQVAQFKITARADRAAEVAAIASAIQLQQERNRPQTNPEPFSVNGTGG